MPNKSPFLACGAAPSSPGHGRRSLGLASDRVRRAPVLQTPAPATDEHGPWLTFGTVCAIAPLVAGLAVFGAWSLTGWFFLEFVAFFVAIAGTIAVVFGALCAAAHVAESVRAGRRPGRRVLVEVGALVSLLVLNVPASHVFLELIPQRPLR